MMFLEIFYWLRVSTAVFVALCIMDFLFAFPSVTARLVLRACRKVRKSLADPVIIDMAAIDAELLAYVEYLNRERIAA